MKIVAFLAILMQVILITKTSRDLVPTMQNRLQTTFPGENNISEESSHLSNSIKPQSTLTPQSKKIRQFCEKLSYLRNYSDIREHLLSMQSPKDACLVMSKCHFESAVGGRCKAFIDPLGTCFLETEYNETAYNTCPEYLEDIPYYPDNVTRKCRSSGTWEAKTDYSACRPILDEGMICNKLKAYFESGDRNLVEEEVSCENYLGALQMISYIGRAVSLASLTVTFVIFWKLRSIRCWRNIIHWNLVASFIIRNVMWIVLNCTIDYKSRRMNTVLCRILVTIFNYSQMTNYFWMLVEGLYLHIMVVLAYSSKKIKLRYYFLAGWGFPFPFMITWVVLKAVYEDTTCWMRSSNKEVADYSWQIPILIILVINAMILANIVRILITKLRSQRMGEDRQRFKKAVKAAFFLFPLLGVTYVVFLVSPDEGTIGQIVFLFLNTILQSFQGFLVCAIYCFANMEIQSAIKKELQSWIHHNRIPCFQRKEKTMRRSSISLSRTTFTTGVGKQKHRNNDERSSKSSTPTLSPASHKPPAIPLIETAYAPSMPPPSTECFLAKDKYSDTDLCLLADATPENQSKL